MSTSWCCFNLGSGVISWPRRKQNGCSLCTTEVEYIATCLEYSKTVWLCKLLAGLFDTDMDTNDIYCDYQSCIKLTQNPMFHDNSKHIGIKYHYIWDMVKRGALNLQYAPTKEQVVDVLTKPLSRVKLEHSRQKLGVV